MFRYFGFYLLSLVLSATLVVLLLALVGLLTSCITTPVTEPAPVLVQNACPDTKVLAMDSEQLTPQDLAALRTARNGCATKHAPDNTCLKKFIRIEHGRYHAVCGPAN